MKKKLAALLVFMGVMYGGATAGAQDKPLKKFRWGVTSLSASQWIPWIAKEAKLYEKYGLEAELAAARLGAIGASDHRQ